MQASQVPNKFPLPFAKNAGGGFKRPIPASSQIGIQNGAASLNDGFPPDCFLPIPGGGVPPFGQDFNGLLFQSTSWDQWYSIGGPIIFDATQSASIGGYPKGAVVQSTSSIGAYWVSTVDDNPTNPDTGGANWVGFSPCSMYAVDSGTANACVITLVPPPVSLAWLTGMPIRVGKGASVNTGPVTLNVNGTGATAVIHPDLSALVAGELPAGGIFTVVYDGVHFQLQSASATAVTPAELQVQPGNYAVATGSNNLVLTLSQVPASQAALNGVPLRIKMANGPNTTAVTINVNGFGPEPLQHADGSDMQVGELPFGALFETAYDSAAPRYVLLSPPLAPGVSATVAQMEGGSNNSTFASPFNLPYSEFTHKGFALFHFTGGILTVTYKSSTIQSISRTATGTYVVQLQGGLNFLAGYVMANGHAAISPGSPGSIGMGSSFTGTNQAVTVKFGDAGGSGGELSDPSDACVVVIGATQN